LIAYTPKAAQQVEHLRQHYEDRGRVEAIRALDAALYEAEREIERDPAAGLPASRPYPHLVNPDRLWTKSGRYWIAYGIAGSPNIVRVFYETANIPRRL
jgi:plasmid stabilization system protein ParE